MISSTSNAFVRTVTTYLNRRALMAAVWSSIPGERITVENSHALASIAISIVMETGYFPEQKKNTMNLEWFLSALVI